MVNGQVAKAVTAAISGGKLPVVIAGSCDVCVGVLAGFEHVHSGVVWLDAHADFNTPESTVSGFFPGMSAAVITGHCYRKLWAQIGDATPIAEAAMLMLGVRDLSPTAERDRLRRSAIRVIEWHDGAPQRDIAGELDQLAHQVHDIYLHIDMDVFDPTCAPGVVDNPVPGGLSMDQGEVAIRAVCDRFQIRAATLTTFTPARDQDGKTEQILLRLLGILGEYAGSR